MPAPGQRPPRRQQNATRLNVLEVQPDLLVALPQQFPVQAVHLVQGAGRAGRAPAVRARRSGTSPCPAPCAAGCPGRSCTAGRSCCSPYRGRRNPANHAWAAEEPKTVIPQIIHRKRLI